MGLSDKGLQRSGSQTRGGGKRQMGFSCLARLVLEAHGNSLMPSLVAFREHGTSYLNYLCGVFSVTN
jgi:hypothetical protein